MKKRLKKMLAVICLLTLVFTFTVKPKKADAVFAEMTIASWLAAGGTLATVGPIVVGLAGAAVIGAAINDNWPAIEEFGGQIYDDLIAQGKTPEEIYTQDTDGGFSVTASPDFIKSAAGAVDTMPEFIIMAGNWETYGGYAQSSMYSDYLMQVGAPIVLSSSYQGQKWNIKINSANYPITNLAIYFKLDKSSNPADGSYSEISFGTIVDNGDGSYTATGTFTNMNNGGAITVEKIMPVRNQGIGTARLTIGSSEYVFGEIQNETTYNTADMFGAVADNAYQRELAANAALSDNQVLKITQTQDLTNATLSDMADTSAANYDESRTQTGILSSIWSIIKGIPANIAAAGVAASTAINAAASDLWEDAGAIWSGMADSLTNIQTDVNAKIGAMQTAMTGGIDNIKTDMGALFGNLSAGIDSFAASAAANWASWGQLTLDGIDAGIGAITGGLSTAWTNTTTAIDTAATATTTAITNLTNQLTTGMDQIVTWITDFPTMMLRLIVPAEGDFSFKEKMAELTRLLETNFGSLDTLHAAIGAMMVPTGSIYDIEVSLLGRQYKIVPIILKPTIDAARPFLTAALNLTSITYLIHRNKKELFK